MEDVLEDSIALFGDERVDDESIHYGSLVLTTAPKVCRMFSAFCFFRIVRTSRFKDY